MMTGITKTAIKEESEYRPSRFYPRARDAMKAFLKALSISASERVLLPAYVGYSTREGSGVMDPILELGLVPEFYRLDHELRIDLEHLKECLQRPGVRVLVVIHYFGYVDPAYQAAVTMAHDHGVVVLEDAAHALFTDVIGGTAGRMGDAVIYSLHKMLPMKAGGVLRLNQSGMHIGERLVDGERIMCPSPWDYDLLEIAQRRMANACTLAEHLSPLRGRVDLLWGPPRSGMVPQTLPVLIQTVSRDWLYDRMNNAGFGVVSLYHTLVQQISRHGFPDSYSIARRVMNLPVHQDASKDELEAMVDKLTQLTTTS